MNKESLIVDFLDTYNKISDGSLNTLSIREKILISKHDKFINSLNLPYYENSLIKDPFVHVYDNAINVNVCDELITIFNENKQYHKIGISESDKNTTNNNIPWKISTDFVLEDRHKNVRDILIQIISPFIKDYFDNLYNTYGFHDFSQGSIRHFQIQYSKKNSGRFWLHNDFKFDYCNTEIEYRFLTYIYYLNDVEEGGETVFMNYKIKPKKGRLLLFPASWNYIHGGNIPKSNDKYILTGWFYAKR